MNTIHGSIIDKAGRCVHYDSAVDVVANKCYCCKKFYACYQCHNEYEDHFFLPWPIVEDPLAKIVLCGKCNHEMNHDEYKKSNQCSNCGHLFNSNCSRHSQIYFRSI
ncbi:CHY zinc finger protein [Enterococcus sp. DIV0212c]|uniref:CHY zinc finger protein n=1 Tax=Enterococcus sp. DIV0212c TaxID=2230867 RepID=UPI001A9C0F56|nr:hypothetical protein [Enterococcus sp. DIV0212c]